ncbi:MAG: EAL domain-containing protein [Xanthomonadaceae bacterium]|nr:EAL domain-containing protein [Xanthomonadaceae bacterium]
MSHSLNPTHAEKHAVAPTFSDCVDPGFTFAFQPIVAIDSQQVLGHEALVRGLSGEPAAAVIAAIGPGNRFFFDQICRMRALHVAARRNIAGAIHLNCSHVVPANLAITISATRDFADEVGINPKRVVLEFGGLAQLGNPQQLYNVHIEAQKVGFRVLADNFGAGEIELKRLAVFKPHFAKLDRTLIAQIESSPRRQALVHGIVATCSSLGVRLIASGVERPEERDWLRDAGLRLAQGYLFAHPGYAGKPDTEPHHSKAA